MRIARNVAGYEFGLLIGFVASGSISAWWLLLAVAFLAGFIWLDARVRDADWRRGWAEGYRTGEDDGRLSARLGWRFDNFLQKHPLQDLDDVLAELGIPETGKSES